MSRDFYQEAAEDMAAEFAKQVNELSAQIKKLGDERDYWQRIAKHWEQMSKPMQFNKPLSDVEESLIAKHIKEEEYGKFQLLYGGKK